MANTKSTVEPGQNTGQLKPGESNARAVRTSHTPARASSPASPAPSIDKVIDEQEEPAEGPQVRNAAAPSTTTTRAPKAPKPVKAPAPKRAPAPKSVPKKRR